MFNPGVQFRQRVLLNCCLALNSLGLGICGSAVAQGPSWELVEGDMVTRWAKEVTPDNVLPDYPRPAMRRPRWINLNGLWEFAIRPKNETSRPESFHDHILVPFCAESALSGIKRTVRETDRLWYRRTFEVPVQWQGERILLHFGAVDWEATVWVNGLEATQHRGGYEPFSVDITDLLDDSHPQEIVVSVWDPSDKGRQPRGKQVIIPHGFNYTGASGIWQTVWVEPVPPSHIRSVHTVADIDTNCVWVTVDTVGTHDGCILEAKTLLPEPGEGKGTIPIVADGRAGHRLRIRLREHPVTRLWSPDSPYLYDLQITLRDSKGRTCPMAATTVPSSRRN
jgi:beta-galactosidase/beta-glucuronidase